MKQAIHIFKKDTRFLRLEICLVVLMSALPLLWPFAAAYLIARLIHAEAIPGDNQFWVTRPYRCTSLLTAKLIFIAVFVNLPLFLVQLYQLLHRGFELSTSWPGLVWSNVLVVLCLSLPAAALAAITPGMISFLFLELVSVVLVFVWGPFPALGVSSIRVAWPIGVAWISNSLLITVITAAATSILFLQFYRRQTLWSRIAAAAAMVVGVSSFLLLSPRFALNAQTYLSKSLIDTGSIQLGRNSEPMRIQLSGQGASSPLQFVIPLRLSGLPRDVEVKADGFSGSLQDSNGAALDLFTNGADSRPDGSGNVTVNAVVVLKRAFYREESDRPLTLHGSLYFSLFGNARSQTIPRQMEGLSVMNLLRCSSGEFEQLLQFNCASAFRWPGQMIYARVRRSDPASFYELISYSPFPAELSLTPFEGHTALGTRDLAPPSPLGKASLPDVTIIARQSLAHIRRDVEVPDIRFSELSDRWPRSRPSPPPKPPKP